MLNTIAVIIISDQTVQNVQFIKEFNSQIKQYLFVTTKAMEEKGCSKWIIKTLQLNQEKVQLIQVDEFNLEDISEKLQKVYQENSKYLVNITGGTKLMSIAVNNFFQNKPNAIIYYLTGRNNQFLNLTQREKNFLKSQITLEEYLKSYGIVINPNRQGKPIEDAKTSQSFYNEFLKGDAENIQLLQSLRDYIQEKNKKAKEIEVKEFPGLKKLLEAISFSCKDKISRKTAEYLTGKWLEEYVYYRITQKLNLSEEYIRVGLYLQKEGISKTENDFDVIFVLKNELYIIECKTSHKVGRENKLKEYIYKLDALQKEFGLFAKSFIFTLGDLPTDKNQQDQIKDRLKFHRITLLTKTDLKIENTISFDSWLEKLGM